jgi:hypothetical protein
VEVIHLFLINFFIFYFILSYIIIMNNNNNSWRELFFDKSLCQGKIINNEGNVRLEGVLKSGNPNANITYFAANPPKMDSLSFSSRGLPFPNPDVAFHNTNNVGRVQAKNGKFTININYPNAYYVGMGSLYIPPHIHLKICEPGNEDKLESIKIGEGIPYRTLTHPAPPSLNFRVSPLFYNNPDLPVRSQEQILRDSAYPEFKAIPDKIPDNFWGLRPPR